MWDMMCEQTALARKKQHAEQMTTVRLLLLLLASTSTTSVGASTMPKPMASGALAGKRSWLDRFRPSSDSVPLVDSRVRSSRDAVPEAQAAEPQSIVTEEEEGEETFPVWFVL